MNRADTYYYIGVALIIIGMLLQGIGTILMLFKLALQASKETLTR